MIYLDNAATTPTLPAALEAAWPWLTGKFGNPNSSHELGVEAKQALSAAREKVAGILGCFPEEVIFTSGGTESNNLCIKGVALGSPRGKHIVSAATEHSSVLRVLEFLQQHQGFELTHLPVDDAGRVKASDLAAALRDDTTLVTLAYANNEVGVVHNIAELASVAVERRIPLHTDAVQAPGWLPLNTKQLGVQAMSLSGHKFGAPKGVGVAFVSSRLQLEPHMHGGGQEHGLRSGTQNVAWAVALATALEQANAQLAENAKVVANRDDFIARVLEGIPSARLTGPAVPVRHPASASFVFPGVNGETLLIELDSRGVICSSGSACAAGSTDPSHVLLAMGLEPDLASTSVRFSLSHRTTAEELEQAANALIEVHGKLTER